MQQAILQSLHSLLFAQANIRPNDRALGDSSGWLSYQALQNHIKNLAMSFSSIDISKGERVVIYLPKSNQAVMCMFATSVSGGVFVPINPVLKAKQVNHIVDDCQAKVLITTQQRYQTLSESLPNSVEHIILIDSCSAVFAQSILSPCYVRDETSAYKPKVCFWEQFLTLANDSVALPTVISTDIAAIFYTSGSTGAPKGVVLSHQNLVVGAASVSQYLAITPSDRVLAVLPLSFDYGFSQLTTSFFAGGSCFLMEYLFPQDIINSLEQHSITGLSLIPTLWNKLSVMNWPESVTKQLRYFCNSGGAMPRTTLDKLLDKLPTSKPFLMYGLTEAFRSCYLPPEEATSRPNSFGKAIPNARIYVINSLGEECEPGEEGELVHCGPLVAQGYWNSPAKTAQRFKAAPFSRSELNRQELAVWSGDIVKKDADGYLYFVSRNDDLIKTSGYRVSATEVEDVLYACSQVEEAVVVPADHPELGQAIVAVVAVSEDYDLFATRRAIGRHITTELPNFMRPKFIDFWPELPKNPNGKFDRAKIKSKYNHFFE